MSTVTDTYALYEAIRNARRAERCEECQQPFNGEDYAAKIYVAGTGNTIHDALEHSKHGLWPGWYYYCQLCADKAHPDGDWPDNVIRNESVTDKKYPICHICNTTFTPKRSDSKYCSSKCRQKAYRQRGKV